MLHSHNNEARAAKDPPPASRPASSTDAARRSYQGELAKASSGDEEAQVTASIPLGTGTTMYHVSPRENRERILSEGLLGHEATDHRFPHMDLMPKGNYLFQHPEDAAMFADSYGGKGFDIYQVDARGLPMGRDPETSLDEGASDFDDHQIPPDDGDLEVWPTIPMRFYTPQHVEPYRISLLPENQWPVPSGEHEIPHGWDRLPLTTIPMPGHESSTKEPFFPSLEDAVEANKASLAGWGQTNHSLLRPDVLEGALGRARNYYAYEGSLPKAAAALAHGVGQAQAFEDGNKRTAYWLAHHFLHENDLGHLTPDDDEELADHIIGYGEGTHNMDDTAAMFEARNKRRQSNILDPVHDSLAPDVWDSPEAPEPTLKPDHLEWITSTITSVLDGAGYDGMDEWLSLVLTGSLTTYQYSQDSDCDISLFVNTDVFPEWSRAEMIALMVSKVDGTKLPGTQYPMQCFVVSPKITKEDLYKLGLRSGYDLSLDQWIVPPEKARIHDVEREMNEAYTIALESADKMEKLLRYEPDKAIMYWHQIHARRQRDMRRGKGDAAPSNIIYKMLAHRKLFPEISEVSGEYIA